MGASDDGRTTAIVELLRAQGAGALAHGRGQTLLDHLLGTYLIVRRWNQPAWLQHAALLHSVYGTEAYRPQLLSREQREQVAEVAEVQAERIAYLFCVTPRRPLFAGTHRWARGLTGPTVDRATPADRSSAGGGFAAEAPPTRDELDAVLLLHMANLAEQGHQADGTPRGWLARVRELGELLQDSDSVTPPPFIDQLSDFSAEEERVTRLAYLSAVRDDGAARADRFALAAATCPVVAEPCVWMAYLARGRGDSSAAGSWAEQARRRLSGLGAAWDRRLSPEQWLALIDALEETAGEALTSTGAPPTHPHALLEAVVAGGRPGAPGAIAPSQIPREPSHDAPSPAQVAIMPLAAADGRRRFGRYLEALTDSDATGSGAIYPELPSRPWHLPQDFALVHYLEANFATVREELLGLEGNRFQRESERISRIGDWDVAFFYERGRRHDDLCAACPVTVQGLDTHPTVRTMAGLIYVSRMRPSTHISAHHGPTNLRLRCHLGIQVPEGDCAIRVGEQTRRWVEGRCLVFDDHFEHEAWNHTAHDRIVLIVDLWHPSLSAEEVRLLEALHRYTQFHARRLGRYWSANAAARARQAD